MPYILEEQRPAKDKIIDKLFEQCESKGDINYCITRLVHLWALKQMERVKSLTKKYDILNDAYGIMCSAAGEFYAAVMVPYEKLKRKQNGPVSQLDASAEGMRIEMRRHSFRITPTLLVSDLKRPINGQEESKV